MLRDETPKAAVEHKCWWCPEPITVGTVHLKTVQVNDGDMRTFRMHSECREAFRRWIKEIDPEGWEADNGYDPDDGQTMPTRGSWSSDPDA